ncbi:MAG: DUF2953 domain-containing protein [Oscillospiraceae bacterium]|nr:DUF2953 domain-containing protein [Oscillospiraceae bacterium]
MGWLIFLAVIVLLAVALAFCPVGIKVRYDADGLRIAAFAGLIKFRLYPEFDGEELLSLTGSKKKKSSKNESKQKDKLDSGGKYDTFVSYVRFVAEILTDFRRKLVIKELTLKLTLSSDDPCNLALGYGAAWAAASNLTALMEQLFTVRKHDVAVNHDFFGNQLLLLAKLHISITLGRLSLLGIKYLIRYFTKIKKFSNTKKDGAK